MPLVWDTLGIKDFRFDFDGHPPPRHTWKSEILTPKQPRDFLLNLYFKKPDYEEVHRKMFYATYCSAKLATFTAFFQLGAMKSRSKQMAMQIISKNLIFIGGSGIAYAAVAASAANIRGKKDDFWNHAIAGGSLGFINAFYRQSPAHGLFVGFFCAVGGALLKTWYLHSTETLASWIGNREDNLLYGGDNADLRYTSIWLNTHDTKTRTERYNL